MRSLVPAVASLAFLVLISAPESQASTGKPDPKADNSKTQVVELHQGQMSKPTKTNPPPDLSPSDATAEEKASTPPEAAEPGTLLLVVSAGALSLLRRRRTE